MKCDSTISVHELLGSSIHTREVSSVLMRLVQNNPCNDVELDFSSVEYISRSFADQFHFDKMNCAIDLQKTIIVSNASESVINMLQAVAKSQISVNKRVEKVPVYKYSSQRQLENFLLSF
jgi:hypothetical protein